MTALERYRSMRLCRRFEETVQEQFELKRVPGPLHLAIGQEAVAAGVCAALERRDAITSTHRGHHHCLAKGARSDRMLAELLGRAGGYGGGRGGSMHIAVPELGILGTNGIVGGGIPIATGAAFGFQVQGNGTVAVAFFGEGAAGEGVLAEGLNLAALWKLPILFVCENNHYAELTPSSAHIAGEIWRRGEAHGMPGLRVDGNDVDAVLAAAGAAVERARAGEGPTLIEALTYRRLGHYAGDRAHYRDAAEVEAWAARDPLVHAAADLSADDMAGADADVEQELAAALEWALASEVARPDDRLAAA
jgi:TPP-dependent pyruvate/acetoin dehydrogenase alpha subunit